MVPGATQDWEGFPVAADELRCQKPALLSESGAPPDPGCSEEGEGWEGYSMVWVPGAINFILQSEKIGFILLTINVIF